MSQTCFCVQEEKINKVSIESRVRKDRKYIFHSWRNYCVGQLNNIHSLLTFFCVFAAYLGLKKGFLFMYNLVQFLGYSWIFVNMTVRLFILGQGKSHLPCLKIYFIWSWLSCYCCLQMDFVFLRSTDQLCKLSYMLFIEHVVAQEAVSVSAFGKH